MTAAQAALVSAEAEALQAGAKDGQDKDKNEDKPAATDGGDNTTATTAVAAGDVKPADPVAVVVAVVVPAPAAATVVTDPKGDTGIKPIEAGGANPAAPVPVPAPAPTLPADQASSAEPAAPDAAPEAAPDTATAAAKTAPAQRATDAAAAAGVKVEAKDPQSPASNAPPEAGAITPPAERKADNATAKSDAHGRVTRVAPDSIAPQQGNAAPVEGTADAQVKATAPHEPRAQPAEPGIAARAAAADARSDGAAPAPTAGTAVSNPPIMPFNLAVSASLPTPTLWPTAALRLDATDNPVPVAGLAVEIVSRAQDGLRRFDIRLDPPELGRIDVRLDVDQGGKVTSHLVVERTETLDLLRRDAPQLERALQHAGLNTEGGLQFSLRDQSFAGRDQAPREGANISQLIIPEDESVAAEAARRGYGRLIGLGGGVDIKV